MIGCHLRKYLGWGVFIFAVLSSGHVHAMEMRVVLEFFPDGTPKRVATISSGDIKLDETIYRPDGTVLFTKVYGELWGEWVGFDEHGDSIKTGNFIVGDREDMFLETPLDSVYAEVYPNGLPKLTTKFEDNYLTGPWKSYYENGNVESDGLLEGGKIGRMERFTEEGIRYYEQFINGDWTYSRYYMGGVIFQEGLSNKNNPELISRQYHGNGALKEEVIFHTTDHMTSTRKSFHVSGVLQNSYSYKNGKQEGPAISCFPTGDLEIIGQYSNGAGTGKWMRYYKNHMLMKTWEFVQEKPGFARITGEYVEYYPDGKLKCTGRFKREKWDGPYIEYSHDGRISKEVATPEDSEQWDFKLEMFGYGDVRLTVSPRH